MRLFAVSLCVALLAGAGTASAKTVWLCKPGLAVNPCARSLTTTVVEADGSQSTERTRRPRKPKIDCFYVYPTVSGQATTNATRTAESEQKSVAEQQAARFSRECRMFAPVYRQLTLSAIGGEIPEAAARLAYGDVRSAWRDYLRNHTAGAGWCSSVTRKALTSCVSSRRTRSTGALKCVGDSCPRCSWGATCW
jgi:hypothetical protein